MTASHAAVAVLGWALRRRPLRAADSGRPRVVFLLAHAYGIGGTTRTCLNLAGALAADHEVIVLSVLRTRDRSLLPQPPDVTVLPVDDRVGLAAEGPARRLLRRLPSLLILPSDQNMSRRVSLYTDLALARALWNAGDGTFIGTRPALNNLLLALRRSGSPAIAQEHMNFAAHKPANRRELTRIYRQVDAAVMLTEGDREAFRAAAGPGANLAVIPNGVPAPAGGRAPITSPTVVGVGRLTHQKGFERLVDAFAEVAPVHPEWRLRICGAGPRRARLEQQIADRGLEGIVTLTGQLRNVERELRNASVFALSSRFEGLPMALIEAMSVGLPVVAFDCPTGPREVIEHGRSGLLVPEGDVPALALGLLELIEDEARRRALADGALERSRAFEIEAIAPRWAELMTTLRAAHPTPAPR
jgi:glycosyltransferase involved in cell wall biosynthesis